MASSGIISPIISRIPVLIFAVYNCLQHATFKQTLSEYACC
jgi:hypothetical protein